MMNGRVGLVLVIISLIIPVLSSAIIVSPSTISQTVYTFAPATFNLTITNSHSFDIFFLNFSKLNDFTFPALNNLSAGGNITLSGTISTTTAYSNTVSSLITYFYKSNINADPVTKNVSINASGFQPLNSQIIQGSIVRWTNNDTLTHTVTSTIFDQSLAPGETFQFTFNTIGNVSYFDRNTNLQGKVEVLDPFSLQFVHSPDNDVRINFSITSVLVETNLSATLLSGDKYTIDYNSQKGGVIKVSNVGSTQLRNVRMSANQWTLFSQNNFNVNSSQDVFAIFNLIPLITNESETGKNYSIIIDVFSDNALPVKLNLSVSIPLVSQVIPNSTTACDFFREKKVFCTAFPTSPFCATEPIIKEVSIVKYESPPLPYNYTQEDVLQLNRKYMSIDDRFQRFENYVKKGIDDLSNSTTAARANSEQTRTTVESLRSENEDRKSLNKTLTVLAIILLVLVVVGGVGGYMLWRFLKFNKQSGATKT